MKRLKGLALACLVFLLPGCLTTYHMVEFEVLEPSEITFPEEVRMLLVMERLPQARKLMDSVSLATIGQADFRGLDTLISYNIFRGLYKRLKQSPIESHQWPMWDSERQSDLLYDSELRLTKREVEDLCRENLTDAILCLESCKLKLRLRVYNGEAAYKPRYWGHLTSHWVVYLPDRPKPFYESTVRDSINYHIGSRHATVHDIIRNKSYVNGQHFGEKITPFWKPSRRDIFSGAHPALNRAADYTHEGNWEQAFLLWSDLSLSGKKSNQAKALYNMAVYYELEDRLDSAIHVLDRAVLLSQKEPIPSYRQEMHQRLEKRQSVILQLEGARLERLP